MVTYPPEMLPSPDEDADAEVIVDGRVVYRKDGSRFSDSSYVIWPLRKVAICTDKNSPPRLLRVDDETSDEASDDMDNQ